MKLELVKILVTVWSGLLMYCLLLLHGICFDFCEDDSFGTFDLDDTTYELIQFHIHTGSEHTVLFQDLFFHE